MNRKLRYYISGPMRGIPEYNFPAFDHAAAWLRSKDIEAINPADHDREVDPDCESKPDFATGDETLRPPEMHFDKLIGWDLEQISDPDCAGLVLLAGWENSTGAAIELAKARELGKEVWHLYRHGSFYTLGPYRGVPSRVEGEDIEALELTALAGQQHAFTTKDSGKRTTLAGGMVRDTEEGKPRYDLIPLLPLRRLAELYARGAEKYEARNWEKACDIDALERFKGSALRHLFQALEGDRTEDHLSAVVFNIFGWIWLEEKLRG